MYKHLSGALFVLGEEKPTGWRHGAEFHEDTVIYRLINIKRGTLRSKLGRLA